MTDLNLVFKLVIDMQCYFESVIKNNIESANARNVIYDSSSAAAERAARHVGSLHRTTSV